MRGSSTGSRWSIGSVWGVAEFAHMVTTVSYMKITGMPPQVLAKWMMIAKLVTSLFITINSSYVASLSLPHKVL